MGQDLDMYRVVAKLYRGLLYAGKRPLTTFFRHLFNILLPFLAGFKLTFGGWQPRKKKEGRRSKRCQKNLINGLFPYKRPRYGLATPRYTPRSCPTEGPRYNNTPILMDRTLLKSCPWEWGSYTEVLQWGRTSGIYWAALSGKDREHGCVQGKVSVGGGNNDSSDALRQEG